MKHPAPSVTNIAARPRPLTPPDWMTNGTPAEAATDVGLDLDGDGHPWQPAPFGTLARPMATILLMLAAVFALLFGADVLAWWLQ